MNRYTIADLIQRKDNGENLKFIFFWGHSPAHEEVTDKSCLSQWYPAAFCEGDLLFKTAEHYMMAQKARLFNDEVSFKKILSSEKPGEAKALGRLIENFEDTLWNEHRFEIVKRANVLKFQQYPELKKFLCQTGDRILAEASPVDTIWGIGLSADDPHAINPLRWKGQNLLGFALMEIRDTLCQ